MKTNNPDLLQVAEYLSISGAVFGSCIAVAAQQVLFAVVPLSLSLTLNLFNRQRMETLTTSRLTTAITQLENKLGTIKTIVDERVYELKMDIGQLNEQAQKLQENPDVDILKETVTNLKEKLMNLEETVTGVNNDLINLTEQTKISLQNTIQHPIVLQPSPQYEDYSPQGNPTIITTTVREPELANDPQDIVRRYHW